MDDPTKLPATNPLDRPGPPSVGARLAEIRLELEEHFVWENRDGTAYCHACARGGYRIRGGATPTSHAETKAPPTHRNNMIWLVVEYFRARGEALPVWPAMYANTSTGMAYCYLCERKIGPYQEEVCQAHDATHLTLTRDTMRDARANLRNQRDQARAIAGTANRTRTKRLSWLQEVIDARVNPDTLANLKPVETAEHPDDPWRTGFYKAMQRTQPTDNFIFGEDGEMLFHEDLDRLVTHGALTMSGACARDIHVTTHPRPCQRPGECQCYCHRPPAEEPPRVD